MRTDESKFRAQIQLQLRVRALLFDKACVSLFTLSNRSSTSSYSKLNSNLMQLIHQEKKPSIVSCVVSSDLQLHGDDIFYTLENPTQNVPASSKVQTKSTFGDGSGYNSSEDDNISQRYLDSWQEYLNMEQQGGSHDRGKIGIKNCSSSEHALEMSRHTVSRLLMNVGFDLASVDILAQLVGCHISKLGRILKVLSDSYRKDCSAIGLLKMFLQTIGHGAFSEVVKDGTKNNVQQTQMQVQAMQMQSQTRVGQLHQSKDLKCIHIWLTLFLIHLIAELTNVGQKQDPLQALHDLITSKRLVFALEGLMVLKGSKGEEMRPKVFQDVRKATLDMICEFGNKIIEDTKIVDGRNLDKEKCLLQWGENNGVKSRFDIAYIEGAEREAIAREDLEVGDIPLEIPVSAIISEDLIYDTNMGDGSKGEGQAFPLVLATSVKRFTEDFEDDVSSLVTHSRSFFLRKK
ncbi:hypothetical protein L2E82_18072 [Cichorium intybus]|uniref:Uncharacterized protein n=1 Tax=Cichorium intybus TaxID=13427 RepID=A0ACB9F9Y8_CICIN|nr:hypothetical protein L2E82_18072 [Cichorium intybus]